METSFVRAEFRKPHYCTRLWRAHHRFISHFYDPELFTRVCNEVGIPPEYLLEDDNWVSNEFLTVYMEKLKELTGDVDIATKLGRFIVSPETSAVEYTLNQAIGTPFLFYNLVPVQWAKYNNVTKIKLERWRPGHFEYVLRLVGDELPSRDVCSNTDGFLEGTGTLFGLESIEISHTECVHRGDKQCRIQGKYIAKAFWKRKLLTGVFAIATVIGFHAALSAGSNYFSSSKQINIGLSVASYFLFLAALFFASKFLSLAKYTQAFNEQSRNKSSELFQNYVKLNRRYQEANLLRDLATNLSKSSSTTEVVKQCLSELDRRFDFSRAFIMLLSSDRKRLYTAAATGSLVGIEKIYGLNLQFPPVANNPQIFANILVSGKLASIFDVEIYAKSLKPENQQLIRDFNVNSLIVAPISDESSRYGLLVIGAIGDETRLSEEDQHLIENVARLLTLAFQNAGNFEKERNLRTLFQKYVPAMVLGELGADNNNVALFAPKSSYVTSIFVDLRDFTSRCERLKPEQIVDLINVYTDFVTERIAGSGGMVDKLVGDGINSFFVTDTHSRTGHARAAIVAAMRILSDLHILNSIFVAKGYGVASVGVGVHTGWATVGNMGCDRKLDFTAVGDTVNTASRLQDLTKRYGSPDISKSEGSMILSESTFKRAMFQISAENLGLVEIRGKQKTEQLYRVTTEDAVRWLQSISCLSEPCEKTLAKAELEVRNYLRKKRRTARSERRTTDRSLPSWKAPQKAS